MKLLKKFKGKQINFFKKNLNGGMNNYNIKPKVYKSQKGNVILNKLKIKSNQMLLWRELILFRGQPP